MQRTNNHIAKEEEVGCTYKLLLYQPKWKTK